ncbi:hypothetical protein JTB14_025368 [Gonioctena quinquepunctata]|nr:hypothetical protein JTB14_025368 [Gonioctena quinquepunctata]
MKDIQVKPFACTVKDCEMTFTNKDHLEWHQKKHDMMLNLGLVIKNNDAADQTPTPTRFIRNCEEVGLFQDLQNVNPFDEIFKRATDSMKNGETLEISEANNSDDTLHTPHILPHIEGNKKKSIASLNKPDNTDSCDFTLQVDADSTSPTSPKTSHSEKDSPGAKTVKEKILETLQNKERLKNNQTSPDVKFISVVPFQDLKANKDAVIDLDANKDAVMDLDNGCEDIREKIREMNRAAQSRCRKRKQQRQREMEEEIRCLREENKKLKLENHLLKLQLDQNSENASKDAAPTSTTSDKSSQQQKVPSITSPPTNVPIIIHIGPNITSPTIPVITSTQKDYNHILLNDNHITKPANGKKKIFRKIVPKIIIEEC